MVTASVDSLTRSWNEVPPGGPMSAMTFGLAAIASLNWDSIVAGAQAENCDFKSTPKAAAACPAPVWRASVAPSPALPPICIYITRPLPIGSAAEAGPATAVTADAATPGQKRVHTPMFLSPYFYCAPAHRGPPPFRS